MQNDLISREAVLNIIRRQMTADGIDDEALAELEVLECEFEELPAVDAEPVEYSMWLEHAGSQNTRYWTCLKCDTLGSPRWNRCPICEAKMNRGKQ